MSVRIQMVPFFEKVLGHEATVKLVMRQRAEHAASIARATAPVASGDYRDGIGVEVDGDKVMLVANDFKSHWIEWGTIRTRAHATLRNAARAVTRRVRDT